jgi:hypothetical protein
MSTRNAGRLVAVMVAGVLLGSCSNQGTTNNTMDMAPAVMCFMNPMTYVQIINACTSAVSVDQPATLPKFQQGATLMPLP